MVLLGIQQRADRDGGRTRQLTRTVDGDALNAAFERSFAFARSAAARLTESEQQQLADLLRKAIGG